MLFDGECSNIRLIKELYVIIFETLELLEKFI